MRALRSILLTAAAITLISTGAQAANLIVDGSFENTTGFVPNGDDTMSLIASTAAPPGWTVTGDSIAWIGPANPFSLTASDGDYFLDLTDYPGGPPFGGVTQTINTVLGQQYVLSFDLGSSNLYGIPDGVTVNAGASSGTFNTTLTGTNNWERETLSFIGTGGPTVITLQGNSGNFYIGLDNVSVVAVPEPSTWALMLLGFGSIGAGMRLARRRVAAA